MSREDNRPPASAESVRPVDGGDGPVVVLVHGQPGAGADWVALSEILEADHRVLAPDRPGWGSDPRPAAGIEENAEVFEAWLEAVGAKSPVTVVGHSLGGGIALFLALNHPTRVGALVLVGSVGVVAALSGFDRLLAVPMLGDGIVRAGVATLRRGLITATHYSERHPGSRAAQKVPRLPTLREALGTDALPMVGRSRQSFLVEQRALVTETPKLERALGRVAVPTVVVSGASDHIVPTAAARSLAGRVPGAELIVVPGGHLLPFDQPAMIAEVVRRYSGLAAGLTGGPQRRETPGA